MACGDTAGPIPKLDGLVLTCALEPGHPLPHSDGNAWWEPAAPKHRGLPRRCVKCGWPELDHPYRHPFVDWADRNMPAPTPKHRLEV